MEKPDVDTIEGLSPAISIEQKTTSRNPRSTVGTVTEIHDYLRLLWASVGVPHCPTAACRSGRRAWSRWSTSCWPPAGTRFVLLAPVVEAARGSTARSSRRWCGRDSCGRGSTASWSTAPSLPELDKNQAHDRGGGRPPVGRDGVASRLADSLETALGSAKGWRGRR
jgi:excinuclease ABC subunit A